LQKFLKFKIDFVQEWTSSVAK